MKIILFSRPLSQAHRDKIVQIFAVIERYGFDWAVNEEAAECIEKFTERIIAPENRYGQSVENISDDAVMVCYGGDGTLLEGVHRLNGSDISVVGINSGRLGFLALAQSTEIDEVFEQIASRSLLIEQRSMLSVSGTLDGKKQSVYALNEVAVQRLGATMISVDVAVDSLPTLTSLSPHNLTLRPVVAPDSSTISLAIHTRKGEASISVDNRTFAVADGEKIEVKISKRSISLAVPHNISFYDTLRNKLMWGVDNR